MLALWEILEEWMFLNEGRLFTVHELAADLGISVERASRMIVSYQRAQRGRRAKTLYVIKRQHGRTSAAVWSFEVRVADVRALSKTTYEDIKVKLLRAFVPDIARIGERNPAAGKLAGRRVEAAVEHIIPLVALALGADDE